MEKPTLTKAQSVFSLSCRVELNIRARAERVWRLLTDAKGFPSWNSTVSGIEGQIREGQRLRLHVPGIDRTFTPTVSGMVANERMTWTGGFAPMFKGVRTFELKSRNDGSTDSAMEERFSGLMLPLVKSSLPDIDGAFATYASDLNALRKQQARIGGEPALTTLVDEFVAKAVDLRLPL